MALLDSKQQKDKKCNTEVDTSAIRKLSDIIK